MTPLGTNPQIPKQDTSNEPKVPVNKQNGTAVHTKQLDLKGKVYKLMIQIDKVRAKPGPKCKKAALLAASKKERIITIKEVLNKHNVNLRQNNSQVERDPLSFDTIIDNSKPKKFWTRFLSQCSICAELQETVLSLLKHQRERHCVCPMCEVPFASQVLCDKHESLHKSDDTLLIYKCHLCTRSYDCTNNLKIHMKKFHWSSMDRRGLAEDQHVKQVVELLDYECGICTINVKDENAYRTHMLLHKMNVHNPILNPPEKISEMRLADQQSLKYTCTICSQTFHSPSAAEAHTCTSIDSQYDKKTCNICQKVFETDDILNLHLANHLTRAHFCTVCRKAFVNRATLKVHMKSHDNDS